ncbi:MAG: hypothetical protein QOF51_603, partial [Chloroflexota bacterium]|nr:hypothetical protein [Chloroflexota bacterium]
MGYDLLAVLDECLASVRAGRASVDACLARYPELADKLGSLLPIALAIQPPIISLTPERKTVAREALVATLAVEASRRSAPIVRIRIGGGVWRNSAAAAVAALLLLFTGNRALVSAEAALPGQPLYPLKTAIEEVRLVTAVSPDARVAVAVEIATKRLEEAERAAAVGNGEAEVVARTAYATAVAVVADQQAALPAANLRVPFTPTLEPVTPTPIGAIAVSTGENVDSVAEVRLIEEPPAPPTSSVPTSVPVVGVLPITQANVVDSPTALPATPTTPIISRTVTPTSTATRVPLTSVVSTAQVVISVPAIVVPT